MKHIKIILYINIFFMVIMACTILWFMNIIYTMNQEQDELIEKKFSAFLEQFDVEIIEIE